MGRGHQASSVVALASVPISGGSHVGRPGALCMKMLD